MRVLGLCMFCLLVTGCAGRVVCEWETQDERFEALIDKALEKANE